MNREVKLLLLLLLSTAWLPLLRADGPADNIPEKVRPVPPPGIEVPTEMRSKIVQELGVLSNKLQVIQTSFTNRPTHRELLPDVLVYEKAVHYALENNEIFKTNEPALALNVIHEGLRRAELLAAGNADWPHSTGLVVRAYRSRIDDSIQPYGLVIPPSYRPNSGKQWRLDVWFHGRAEQLSELAFIGDRQKNAGEFTPPDTIVLHPYSRYCNGQKFAGETDFFEALTDVQKRYAIDPARIVVRGFSLGGAACWHLAAHHAGRWAAAAPGAGFSETADFLKVFQNEKIQPTWYEQKLWNLYDATVYAGNFYNLPVVAYSGELDKQKQAADIMARFMADEGISLRHVIGPKTAHKYHPDSKTEINAAIDSIAASGRQQTPREVRFVTYTLKYNQMNWITVEALDQHWERSTVNAEITPSGRIDVRTENIRAFRIKMGPGSWPLDPAKVPEFQIDNQKLSGGAVLSDRSFDLFFVKNGRKWKVAGAENSLPSLRKAHNLQGPIDDAFMERFIFVKPSGRSRSSHVQQWVTHELQHARVHWRKHFRGDALEKIDSEITEEDIASANLVLWGDPESNQLLAKIASQLPLSWSADQVRLHNSRAFSAANHLPVLIYPNPLNPKKYVVLNSSFTFREYDYLNNARQVPKLPDYAVLNIEKGATSRAAGQVVLAGFFDEEWRINLEKQSSQSRAAK